MQDASWTIVSPRPPGCEHREVDAERHLPSPRCATRRQEWLGGCERERGAGGDGTGQPQRQPRLHPFEPTKETTVPDIA